MARPFKEALASGGFLVTAGIEPPKGTDLEALGQKIDRLKGVVDALGVSDNHCGSMHMSPWAVCRLALEKDVEPIMHMACRDRNRIALQSDLLAAASLGIRNILCVSGDHVSFGDHPDAKPVHDIDSVHLLQVAAALNEGHDMADNALNRSTDLFAGAVANPQADPIEPQLIKVDKKINAGAAFLVTHPVFSVQALSRLVEHVKSTGIKVLAGVLLLEPEEVSRYREGRLPGLFVPDHLIDEIEGADMAKCVDMAGSLVKELRAAGVCQGVYISAPGHEEKIPELI
jgi:methylenetetrahydrofolate reductase (NADPH)